MRFDWGDGRTFTPGVDDEYYPVEYWDYEAHSQEIRDALSSHGISCVTEPFNGDYNSKRILIRIGSGQYEGYANAKDTAEEAVRILSDDWEYIDRNYIEDRDYWDVSLYVQSPKHPFYVRTLGGRNPMGKSFNAMVRSIRKGRYD